MGAALLCNEGVIAVIEKGVDDKGNVGVDVGAMNKADGKVSVVVPVSLAASTTSVGNAAAANAARLLFLTLPSDAV